jgi:hypothetical protein
MRRVSLNERRAQNAVGSGEDQIVLMKFEGGELEQAIRLSTHPTERFSVEPLVYGTRSTWFADDGDPADGNEHLFVLVSAAMPSDQEDAPAAAQITLEAVDNQIAEALRSTVQQVTVHIAVVLASNPDQVEVEYRNLRLVSADGDAGEVRLNITREPISEASWPAFRMTKQRFPGLHR